jgi:hypothetical protein
MSFFGFGGGGSATVVNPTRTLEHLGYVEANGKGTAVVTGTASNKGSFVSIGTTTNALCGFTLRFNGGANGRYIVDLSTDNSTANLFPDLLVVTDVGQVVDIFIPLKVPATTTIYARAQCTSATTTLNIAIDGLVASAQEFPGFDVVDKVLAPDTGTTRGNASVNAAIASAAPTFATANASTSAAYGAFLMVPTGPGTATTNQELIYDFATGASDTVRARWTAFMKNNTTNDAVRAHSPLIYSPLASGQKVAYRVWGTTNNGSTDNQIRAAIYGFRNL